MVGTISCAVKNQIVKLISGGDALVIPVSLMTEFYIYPEGRSEKKSYVVYTVTIKTAFGSPHEIMPEANGFVNEVKKMSMPERFLKMRKRQIFSQQTLVCLIAVQLKIIICFVGKSLRLQ